MKGIWQPDRLTNTVKNSHFFRWWNTIVGIRWYDRMEEFNVDWKKLSVVGQLYLAHVNKNDDIKRNQNKQRPLPTKSSPSPRSVKTVQLQMYFTLCLAWILFVGFDVSRSIITENVCENDFNIFSSLTFDL